MKHPRTQLIKALIEFFGDDDARIEHALRVLRYAEPIAAARDDCDQEILLAAALLHDVGIKISEDVHGYNNGKTQEQYGPAAAETILANLDFPAGKIQKVKDIIGNHHSPSRYDYAELEVLKQADRIVNRDDGGARRQAGKPPRKPGRDSVRRSM
jgi:HD superfamily phosphodiesterase